MQSFPFTSQVTYDEAGYPEYDRAVDSDILRNIFKNYYSNGVFPNPSTNFQVVADEGMQVVVRPGACLIEGATGYETEDRTMVVQAAGATDRIDSVVLRLNDNIDYRDIDLYVIKGNSSSEPPELTRTGGVYEIGLANLYVSANSSTITTERITDTRLVTARCGYAMPVQEFDTTALFDQLQAQVNENIELIQRAINQTEAAHLQEQIDSISSDIGTTSIASISDGTLKGAVAKHEQDVNSLNLKMESVRSHVGMIIQSTTLDTEAKVIAIYGGTSWTKIEGRFLLGTSPSYAVNATGGEATHKLTTPEMPSHSHGLNNHTHIIPALSGTTNTAGSHTHNSKDYWVANSGKGAAGYCGGSGTSAVLGDLNDIMYASGSHSHTVTTKSNTTSGNSGSTATTGSGTAHNNMPPYKAVYIWERTA